MDWAKLEEQANVFASHFGPTEVTFVQTEDVMKYLRTVADATYPAALDARALAAVACATLGNGAKGGWATMSHEEERKANLLVLTEALAVLIPPVGAAEAPRDRDTTRNALVELANSERRPADMAALYALSSHVWPSSRRAAA